MSIATRASYAGVINPVLTGYFQDEARAQAKFVGTRIAPLVDIDALGGTATAQVGNSEINLYTNPNVLNPLSAESPAKATAIKDRLLTMELERDGHSIFIPLERSLAAARNGVGYDERAMRHISKKLLGVYENKVLTAVGTVGNYANSHTTTNYQSTPSAAFQSVLQGFIDTIGSDIGYDPNVIIMNPAVATVMQGIDEIRAWNGKFNHVSTGPVNRQLLTSYFFDQFGLELIIAHNKHTDTSNSRVHTFGKNIALLRRDTGGFPNFVTTWVNNWLGSFGGSEEDLGLAGVRSEMQFNPQGELYVAESMYKVTTDNANAGALFTGVIT